MQGRSTAPAETTGSRPRVSGGTEAAAAALKIHLHCSGSFHDTSFIHRGHPACKSLQPGANTTIPQAAGARGPRSPRPLSALGPGAWVSPAPSPFLPRAGPRPLSHGEISSTHTHPARGTLSNSRHGMLRVQQGWRRGGRAGVSAHWLSSGPRDSAAVAATGKSKAFQPLEAKKTLFLGLYISLLGISRCGHRIPPATSLVFPRIRMGPIAQSPVRFLCAVRKKKKKILPRGKREPFSANAKCPVTAT